MQLKSEADMMEMTHHHLVKYALRLHETFKVVNVRADYFERENERLHAEVSRLSLAHSQVRDEMMQVRRELVRAQADIRDLARINDGYEEVVIRLMERFNCLNPATLVEHMVALFEQQQDVLVAVAAERDIARAELTSARLGPCEPEQGEGEWVDADEGIFVEDAAPPKE